MAAASGFARTAVARSPTTPAIQPRSVWAGDSRPPLGELRPEDVRFLLVHHTASPNGADPIGTLRGVYNFHTSAEKGWPDVAYNFFIDQNGVVYEGRAGSLAGPVEASATGGSQGFAQLVCLLGDFTAQNPTDAALASLNSTLAWLADRYSIDTSEGAQTSFVSRGSNRWPAGASVTASTISGHRDMSQTACPGDTFYPYLVANVQRQVDALRAAAPTPTTGAATTEPTTVETTPATSTTPASSTTPSSATTSAPQTVPSATTTPAASVSSAAPAAGSSGATAATSGPPAPSTTAAGVPPSSVSEPSDVERAADAATRLGDATGRDSANGTAIAVAAGAGAVALAGALFVGVRGRSSSATPVADDAAVDPPSGGGDPLV